MLSKYVRLLSGRPLLYFLTVILGFSFVVSLFRWLLVWNHILVAVRVAKTMLLFSDYLLIEIFIRIHIQKSSIPFVSYSTTVSHLRYQISHRIPRRHFQYCRLISNVCRRNFYLFSFVNIELQNLIGSLPIRIIEIIDDIPAQSFKSFSLNDNRMIPTQTEKNSSIRYSILWFNSRS